MAELKFLENKLLAKLGLICERCWASDFRGESNAFSMLDDDGTEKRTRCRYITAAAVVALSSTETTTT